MRKAYIFFILILLTSCAQNRSFLKPDYVGERASIGDSFQGQSKGNAFFFVVKSINGKAVFNAIDESMAASYGKGLRLTAQSMSRDIPIRPLKIVLSAKTIHAAPIAYIGDTNVKYEIEGAVEFLPQANMKYLVKGELSPTRTAVWIENLQGEVVSKVVERPGSVPTASAKVGDSVSDSKSLFDSSSIQSSQGKTEVEGSTKTSLFLKISGGETPENVIAKLGKPDRIVEKKPNAFTSYPNGYTVYYYNNLGHIKFLGVQPNIKTVEKVVSDLSISETDVGTIKQLISTNDGMLLQQSASGIYRQGIRDVEVLDVIAEKLWLERNTNNDFMEDGVAWLTRILGQSGNSRYKSLFENILRETKSRKIKRYVEANISLISDGNVPQFIPSQK